MHIWLTIPNLSKKSGGRVPVVQHLSDHLASLGVSVTVLTLEADSGTSEALPQDRRVNVIHVPTSTRSRLGGGFRKTLQDMLVPKNVSIVHDFGIWLPQNHALASVCNDLRIPLVCSTCGALSPWALQHKAWKKRLAWRLYQRKDLSRAALMVATAEQEVKDIRRRVPGKNIALVPNGVELPEGSGQWSAVSGQRTEGSGRKTALFLGRIHPVKGLKNLVEAWHRVRPAGWHCILAGPDKAGHQTELEALLRQRNLASVFEFPGMMEDEQKWALLREADLFVLPSFTENFGISVAEALACGVPVITTKGTPWRNLVDHRCGWWVDIGVEPLAAALRKATSLSDQQRYEMGQRGRRLIAEKYSWPKIGREMKAVYEWVLNGGTPPACVNLVRHE